MDLFASGPKRKLLLENSETSVQGEESTDPNLVASSLQELRDDVHSIMATLKVKEEPSGKKKRVTMTLLYQAILNIQQILRLNGFAVPHEMLPTDD